MARHLLDLALGFALGLGATSTLYFVLLTIGLGHVPSAVFSDLLLLALGGALRWRRRAQTPAEAALPPGFKWAWLGGAGLAVAAAFLIGSIVHTAEAMPYGDWDAWAIWNMRAKFLASDNWHGSISKEIGLRSHPEYPLLWPAAVAKTWSWTGSSGDPAVPICLSALASLTLASILLSGVWLLRGAAMGAMSALVMVTAVSFWQYAPLQYVDIPLAMFMLGSLCAAVLAESQGWEPGLLALSGGLASLATWTKDEGLVFFAALAAALLAAARKRALPWALAAAPAALLVASFKLLVSPGTGLWGWPGGDVLHRIGVILRAFGEEILGLGHYPAHPLILIIVCVALLGVRRPAAPLWPIIPVAALAAGYMGAYVSTKADLAWHLGTSATRLVLQIIPLILFCLFLLLKSPVSSEPAAPRPGRKK